MYGEADSAAMFNSGQSSVPLSAAVQNYANVTV